MIIIAFIVIIFIYELYILLKNNLGKILIECHVKLQNRLMSCKIMMSQKFKLHNIIVKKFTDLYLTPYDFIINNYLQYE